MKEENKRLEINGNMETVDFKIKTDDNKMFHLLSNLYSNPLGSTIREISTNCIDAHKINNNEDRPFIIKQSSKFDSDFYLSFRDFGPGMNHDDIKSIFCTFGKSTKDNSNDVVGCLGLGSKSPLSIADAFNVISINNGTKTIYNITKSSEGIPQLIVFGSSETDEENGLEVKIPILDKYKNNIKKEILEQLMFFKQKPLYFIGEKEEELDWENKLEQYYKMTDHIYIRQKNNSYYAMSYNEKNYSSSYIIQGGVKYVFNKETFLNILEPVSDQRLKTRINKDKMQVRLSDYTLISKLLDDHSIYLFADIGNVSFMPSRENLIYDSNTVEYIYQKFIQIIDQFQKTYNEITSSLECEWDKHVIINLKRSYTDMNISEESKEFFSKLNTSLIENYTNSLNSFKVGNIKKANTIDNKILHDIRFMNKSYKNDNNFKYTDIYIGKKMNSEYYNRAPILEELTSNLSSDIKFVFTDISEKNSRMKVTKYFSKKEPDIKHIIFIRTSFVTVDKKTQIKYVTEIGFNKSSIVDYSDICKEYEIIREQEKLEKRKENKLKGKTKKIKTYQVSKNDFCDSIKDRERREMSLSDFKGIKILTHQNKILETKKISVSSKYADLNSLYVLFNSTFLFSQLKEDIEIVYLNKKDYDSKEAQHLKTLQELYEEVLTKYKNSLSGKKVSFKKRYNFSFNKLISLFNQFIDKSEKKEKFRNIPNLFYKKDIEFVKQYNKYVNKEDNYIRLEWLSYIDFDDKKNIEKINEIFDIDIIVPENPEDILDKIYEDSSHFKDLLYHCDAYNINKFEQALIGINKDLYIKQCAPSNLLNMHLKNEEVKKEIKIIEKISA